MRLAAFPCVAWLVRRRAGQACRQYSICRGMLASNNHPVVSLRNATINDLTLLKAWDEKPHLRDSSGDKDFNDWNWEYELPRNPFWRHQLIAMVDHVVPIGFVQIMDPAQDETHYWGGADYCDMNLRAIDIWIGEEDYLGQGYGTQMMKLALKICFDDCTTSNGVNAVLVDPMYDNTAAHCFYQRMGFRLIGERYFGPDRCLVHCLNRSDYEANCQLRSVINS